MLAIVHDLAEAQGNIYELFRYCLLMVLFTNFYQSVGDIAPREGIPKAEKRRLEAVEYLEMTTKLLLL